MVPAPSPPDAEADLSATWLDELRLALRLGHRKTLVLVDRGHEGRLRELTLALLDVDPALRVLGHPSELRGTESGALVLLVVEAEDLPLLNQLRSWFQERRLRAVLWLPAHGASLHQARLAAPDLFDWISQVVRCQPGLSPVLRARMDQARAALTPVAWHEGDPGDALAWAGLRIARVDASARYEGLLADLRTRADVVVASGVAGPRGWARLRCAQVEAGETSWLVVKGDGVPELADIRSRPLPWRRAVAQIGPKLAALVDLDAAAVVAVAGRGLAGATDSELVSWVVGEPGVVVLRAPEAAVSAPPPVLALQAALACPRRWLDAARVAALFSHLDLAIRWSRSALQVARDDRDVDAEGSALRVLAAALAEAGSRKEALATAERAVEVTTSGHETPNTEAAGLSLASLGRALQELGRDAEAEAAYRASIATLERVFETRAQLGVAASLLGLGNVLVRRGRYDDAERAYRESIEISEGAFGTRARSQAGAAWRGLGQLLEHLARLDDATTAYSESIDILARAFGTREHPEVAASLHGLGNVLSSLRRDDEADRAYRESIGILERGCGTHDLFDPGKWLEQAPESFTVRFDTTAGAFVVRVTREWAPKGADRFYNLVSSGFYTDCAVHRVIEGFVAQFGLHGDTRVTHAWRDARLDDDAVTKTNSRGVVAFATAGPNTRTTQVFVNLGNNARLDGLGFSPFGEVVEGLDVVDALHSGYGESAPLGRGPSQRLIRAHGNAYLRAGFPELDFIEEASVVRHDHDV